MRKALLIIGLILIAIGLVFYIYALQIALFLGLYEKPLHLGKTEHFSLGEPPYKVKSTRIEKYFGTFGGKYRFQISGLLAGDLIDVKVYVDGKLEDMFDDVNILGSRNYEGKKKITIEITAVAYSKYHREDYLEFDYSWSLDTYGGFLWGSRYYMLIPSIIGILVIAIGLLSRKD